MCTFIIIHMMNVAFLLLLLLCHCWWHLFGSVDGTVDVFEAWNRKNYKTKTLRYAMFDPDGIMTFDGNVNGKSNDLVFPNWKRNGWQQETCNKQPELMFQLCETDTHKAWTGMAICYESQLQQPNLNPFYRIDTKQTLRPLVHLMCGNDRQNAIFINRTVVPQQQQNNNKTGEGAGKGGGRKFEKFYSIWTSIGTNGSDSEIYHFKMPKKPEKQCALLRLGGEQGILAVSFTTLRREPLPLYTRELHVLDNTKKKEEADKQMEFPDMANREFSLHDLSAFKLLLLDFLPSYGRGQNISIFGWLPMKIKITSKAIDPCRIDWRLLESREIKGHRGDLKIEYHVSTGLTSSKSDQSGGSTSTMNFDSKTTDTSVGANIGVAGLASVSAEASFSNTYGSQNMQNSDFNIASEMSQTKRNDRTETVQFNNFEGSVNVEQMMYICHGLHLFPDKIRYHDNNGRLIVPDTIEQSSADAMGYDDAYDDDTCQDELAECAIWAAQGECRKSASTMLVQCKASCKLCPMVMVKNMAAAKQPVMEVGQLDADDDEPCQDTHKSCAYWKRMNECQKDPLFMSRQCRKSCGLCIDYEDVDDAQLELNARRQI